ncbi:hypothetical protein CHGG_03190 [Chaetomium globosum CBS 148.51]|uniref:NTF2 domain-containing protein n=1 Tax=Chaetomium globosum (strain ATCC 6205 / CBS 148.51 / DSM 1962 / NBRC 6347 / NRRL 1970) TaxID=306901 RepID=Q2H9B4_CHAGB|nr:uncharacterized protein CHGG_03190 [Chaetomium globosum CBS 148.51]EAQ91255.1 hypothetical protein CHGG_03190 [Chaetomium globosum CBS 148.51]
MATNGNVNHDQYAAPAQTTEAPASTGTEGTTNNLPKDEVGWYFVEQYYTTMSKSPERLHLYYGKKAQFVCGREAQVVNVSFGRQPIQDRIKSMDFQDCKVRISNVDTQGSEENILITVIGEMANKEAEPKKFVQTFVLAQQPSGYFVLNDMLRFLNDDVEEETEAAAEESSARVEMPVALEAETKAEPPAPEEEVAQEEEAPLEPEVVDEKLEVAAEEAPEVTAPSAPEPTAEVEQAAAVEEEVQPQADVEKAVEEIAEEDVEKPEEPKDPAPTPAAAPAPARTPVPAPAPAQPEKPKEPPKPMSWASRVAAGASRPVAPIPKAATPPAPAQVRAPVPVAPQQAAPAAPAAQPQEAPAPAAPKDQGSEWQTAETKRQSRVQPVAAAPAEKEGAMAYIKYVTDKVKEEDLRAALTSFGELAYFDINRQKNCAFVEFKTQAGYNAALAANPHTVNGENIMVEQRRPKANAYGGANYNAGRGGPGPRWPCRSPQRVTIHLDISLYRIDITAGFL